MVELEGELCRVRFTDGAASSGLSSFPPRAERPRGPLLLPPGVCGGPRFEKMQHAAIHAAHVQLPGPRRPPLASAERSVSAAVLQVILLCFRPDKPETMTSVKKKWLQLRLRFVVCL